MSDNPFPWVHKDVILAVFDKDRPNDVRTIRAHCAEHGAYFFREGGVISVVEEGWVPFAWRIDDVPPRDDAKYPPMWTDYLTLARDE
jgi:hypothetical protein